MNLIKLISEKNDYQYCNSCLSEVYHLVYYMPDNDDQTTWTKRVQDFKSKRDVQDYEQITKLVIDAIVIENLKFDVVVRNLAHDQTFATASDSILDFAKSVAKATGAHYCPSLIRKYKPTQALHFLNLQERQNVSKGNFYVNEETASKLSSVNSVLIIDDITTTGTSIKAIAQVLKGRWPDIRIYALCLARTIHNHPMANVNL